MTAWLLAAGVGLAFAVLQYGIGRRARGASGLLVALLRAVAITIVAALLFDAPAGSAKPIGPWVALDASASWLRGSANDSSAWKTALERTRDARGDTLLLFGDSVRAGRSDAKPTDMASLVAPAVERALAAGRPLVVVTDGDLDDPETLKLLPSGSRVVVVPRTSKPDVAVVSLDVPRAIVSGDTVEVKVGLIAGPAGSPASTISLALGKRLIVSSPVDAFTPYSERSITLRGPITGTEGPNVLTAAVIAPNDAERRNDSVSVAVDLSRAASAVFVSTSPDPDARYALSILRGALAIPTRGYLRVAPGMWRVDGALAPVTESFVRDALKDAPVGILHGDTSVFGPPRALVQGPLALLVPPPAEDGEWYVSSAPPSPLSAALSGLPYDSLPPIVTVQSPLRGDWTALEARRGREQDRRPVIVGTERPRRTITVAGSGFWRWRVRGGVAADAYGALWGSVFDFLSAQRADKRAAVPDDRVFRAGEPIRWRRGSAADSVVTVERAQRGGTARADSVVLRFPGDANVVESPPLAAGVYDVSTRGGRSLLIVNASHEWLPRAPRATAGGGAAPMVVDNAPRLRSFGWVFAIALALLCAEWVLRRRLGLR